MLNQYRIFPLDPPSYVQDANVSIDLLVIDTLTLLPLLVTGEGREEGLFF